jgi:hypothetical protein
MTRPHRLGLALVLDIALVALPLIPGLRPAMAQAQSAAPCRWTGEPKTFTTREIGSAIQEGVGFAGVRLGINESQLVAVWGTSYCRDAPGGRVFSYAISDDGRNLELILLQLREGVVDALALMLAPHGGDSLLSFARTTKDISLGVPMASVRAAYGTPDPIADPMPVYPDQGIAFMPTGDSVYAIIVFKPGTAPRFGNILPPAGLKCPPKGSAPPGGRPSVLLGWC